MRNVTSLEASKMVFGDSSSSSLQASRKGAFYTYHFHFPLQNSFPFSDTVLFTFPNAQKLRLRSVHTENRSADVDGGRQSGTGNKPRTRTRLDFQMLTKKKNLEISNLKNAELVKRSYQHLIASQETENSRQRSTDRTRLWEIS